MLSLYTIFITKFINIYKIFNSLTCVKFVLCNAFSWLFHLEQLLFERHITNISILDKTVPAMCSSPVHTQHSLNAELALKILGTLYEVGTVIFIQQIITGTWRDEVIY
jgi:hypothetical protein